MRSTLALIALATMASAAVVPKRQAPVAAKVLVGVPGSILATDFNGVDFTLVANLTQAGTNPSWMAFRAPNLLYAVDEFSNTTRLFTFDPATNSLQLVQNAVGSAGVVHLEFNSDKTRLVGSSFGQGTIDIWDIADGSLRLMKQLASDDALGPNAIRQDAPHPHQAVLDPSGRFFVVNDLGTDTILVIDSLADQFEIVNRVRVAPDGCGPRHGAFFPQGAPQATHYVVLCELLNLVEVFSLQYLDNSLAFVPVQVLSTFGQDFPPANATTATAGEIVVSADNQDIYVSNRNTGNATDSISHFKISPPAEETGTISLAFAEVISSGGLVPRMFSLSGDQALLFSTNQNGDLGLLAISRTVNILPPAAAAGDDGTVDAAVIQAGALDAAPLGAVLNSAFGGANFGPQFAMQVVV